jgi:DNA-binding response OmpR family regulator
MTGRTRVLVVDDDQDTLKLVELVLKTAGIHSTLASGGEEGLRLARAESFDAILLDIMMPDLDGFEVLSALQQDETPPPPVIFLTAKNRPEDYETGIDLGAQSYLVKPVTRGNLLDILNEVLTK